MRKVLKIAAVIAGTCLGLGVAASKVEKNKGWVKWHKPHGIYEREIKRPLDFGLSLFAVLFLWPVMLVIALLVRIQLGVPVLFQQERPGIGSETFIIRKFRTMLDGKGDDGERLTGFGKALRSTSLDELPELFNIIRGDMSIVGPRPLLVEYLPRYSIRQLHRHDVRPGLTGLAQVSGRNGLSWEEKFEADIRYVENITFLGDLKIIAETVAAVIGKKGISSKTSVTMEAFTGSEK